MIPEPASWPAVPPPADPVEFWLQRARCCGSPQSCGALCMDSEASQTEAAVVRRLDEAEAALARLSALVEEYERDATEADEAAATFPRRDDAHVDLRRRAARTRGQARRIRSALAGEEL